MKLCKKCGNEFPNRKEIDGKIRVLNSRKFCLECSPFNTHNTKNFLNPNHIENINKNGGKKQCSICKIDKHYSQFYVKKNKTLSYACKTCMSTRNTVQRVENKRKAIEYKGGKCVKCGYDKYYGALEFHHLDPTKKEKGLTAITSFDKVKKELDKCILVCANCHREIHGNITPV